MLSFPSSRSFFPYYCVHFCTPFASNGALVRIPPFLSHHSFRWIYFRDLHSYFPTQAESELSDTAKREALDATIAEARLQLLRSLGFSTSTQDDDPKLRALVPPFKVQLRAKAKDLLIEEEVRRRK